MQSKGLERAIGAETGLVPLRKRRKDKERQGSHETMCTQHGNASTEKRFMPQSKMRILGSGTPRLYRDLG